MKTTGSLVLGFILNGLVLLAYMILIGGPIYESLSFYFTMIFLIFSLVSGIVEKRND